MFSFTVCVDVYRCMCVWLLYRKQQKNKRIKNEKVAKVNIVYVPSSPNMLAVHLVAVLLRSVSPLYQLTASVGGEAAAGRVLFFLLFYSACNFFFTKLCSLALFHSSVAFLYGWLVAVLLSSQACYFFSRM